MRKYVILLLILCSVGLGATSRLAILSDLHASNDEANKLCCPSQDGGKYRIFENWSQRLTEFATTINKDGGVDYIVLLGDIIDSFDDDPNGTLSAVADQLEAETNSGKIIFVAGNHDVTTSGIPLTVQEFNTHGYDRVASDRRLEIASGNHVWPGRTTGKLWNCFWKEETDFHFVILWGNAKAGWDTADPANFEYQPGETIKRPGAGDGGAANQIDWFEIALSKSVKPAIVLCHEHLSDTDGAGTIDEDVLTSLDPNVQGIITAAVSGGQPVNVFQGHLHKVLTDGVGYWRKDVIGGADYYSLRGSLLGGSLGDMRGNTFYIIDVDTVKGVTAVKTYRYFGTARDRYNTYDLDSLMDKERRGRERQTY